MDEYGVGLFLVSSYNNRDHPKKRGGGGQEEEGGPEKGRRLLCDREGLGIPVLEQGIPSSWDVRPPDFVCFSPPKQAVASLEPNFWTHSLQIHYNGLSLKTVTLQLAIVGPKDLGTPAHLISSPRPMPRRKKCPRTNEGNPNYQIVLLRMTLSSASQNHGREKRNVARGNPLEDRKKKFQAIWASHWGMVERQPQEE